MDSGFRVLDLGFRVLDLGFRVLDLGFGVQRGNPDHPNCEILSGLLCGLGTFGLRVERFRVQGSVPIKSLVAAQVTFNLLGLI